MLTNSDVSLIADIAGVSNECQSVEEFAGAVLDPMNVLFGSRSSLFYTFSGADQGSSLSDCFPSNVDPFYCHLYQQNYFKHDPCYQLFSRRVGEGSFTAVSTNQAVDHEYGYVNSAYYEDFLRPQHIHKSLIFSVGYQKQLLGLFGFHRSVQADHYTTTDHLKAQLLALQFSLALKGIACANKSHATNEALKSLMEQASVCGYLAIGQEGKILSSAINDGLLRDADTPEQFWQKLVRCLPPAACEFVTQALKGNAADVDIMDVPADPEKHMPSMLLRCHPYAQAGSPHLTVMFLSEDGEHGISTAKLDAFALTKRQREIVRCLAAGMHNALIAHELGISPKTLENHLTAIYKKTGCHNRASLLHALQR